MLFELLLEVVAVQLEVLGDQFRVVGRKDLADLLDGMSRLRRIRIASARLACEYR